MPRIPDAEPPKEQFSIPFLLASRFDNRETSQAPYDAVQEIVRTREVDFSVFRLIQNWPESMAKAPPSNKKWYVIVLGTPPQEPLLLQVRDAINQGEVVDIPDEAAQEMARRRLKEISARPFTEIHRTISVQRSNPNKDKLKRKMHEKSRRRNRGK